uniref:Ig-like domain-containing protein n=1 Tax=Gopherus agassizii TaxID=38772 RepID=A0A452HQI6_9SAUR
MLLNETTFCGLPQRLRLRVGAPAFLLAASEEAGTLKVRQDPAQILAPLGGLVELSCQINTAQRWEQLRVEWQRDSPLMVFCQVVLNKTSVSNCCRGVGVCDDAHLSFTWHPPKFTLRMSNINEDDVGWYVCKAIVEIPVYLDATGNGTMLNTSGRGRDLPGALHPAAPSAVSLLPTAGCMPTLQALCLTCSLWAPLPCGLCILSSASLFPGAPASLPCGFMHTADCVCLCVSCKPHTATPQKLPHCTQLGLCWERLPVRGWLEPCRQNSPAGHPLASERGTQMACVLIAGRCPASSCSWLAGSPAAQPSQ